MNETDKIIEEQWKTLSPNLQQAINAVPWKSIVYEIGRANALGAEQTSLLEQETLFIIYALEPPDDYIGNLIREIGISEEIAYMIAESVSETIFGPISEKARGYQNSTASASLPEIPPSNLPMVEEGEARLPSLRSGVSGQVAHDTPHVPQIESKALSEQTPQVSLPDYRYEGGKDPYREPLK